jgi:hypothetical protein
MHARDGPARALLLGEPDAEESQRGQVHQGQDDGVAEGEVAHPSTLDCYALRAVDPSAIIGLATVPVQGRSAIWASLHGVPPPTPWPPTTLSHRQPFFLVLHTLRRRGWCTEEGGRGISRPTEILGRQDPWEGRPLECSRPSAAEPDCRNEPKAAEAMPSDLHTHNKNRSLTRPREDP